MIRGLIVGLLLGTCAQAQAQDCYYFWVQQCINVIDASQRELDQYVLISPSINYLHSESDSCPTAVAEAQRPADAQLLAAFNQAAAKLDACQTPFSEIPVRVYDQPGKATWHYNRSRKAAAQKTVIVVEGLPIL